MNKLLFLLLPALIGCKSAHHISQKSNILIDIEFQDGFKSDKLSMWIGDCEIFKEIIVSSGFTSGITNMRMAIVGKEDKLLITYDDKVIKCNHENQNVIILNVMINQFRQKLFFSPGEMKFIGLNKVENDSLIVFKSPHPFIHE